MPNVSWHISTIYTLCPLFKYVDDSTICEICDRKSASIIQESVDITARWVEQNHMIINSVKSKEMIIGFTRDSEFLKMPSKLIRILRITFCYKQLCGRCLVHMIPIVKVVIHFVFAQCKLHYYKRNTLAII